MHVILLGTSSVGKSTLSQYFKEIGYTHISCDDYNNKVPLKVENKFYNEIEEYIRDASEPMYQKGLSISNSYVLYDDVTFDICNFYKDRNDYPPHTLYKILLYASVYRIINNIYNRRTSERRKWDVFECYANFYKRAEEGDPIIDVIDKDKFISLLKDKLSYFFTSEENLIEKVNEFFISLGADSQTQLLQLAVRPEIQPDLFIKIDNQTPMSIFNRIRGILHPCTYPHNNILVAGAVCVGKTLVCNEFKKFGYRHIDYKYYKTHEDPHFDTTRYYSNEELTMYRCVIPMYNAEGDKLIYEDVGMDLVNKFQENNKPLFVIFLHLDLDQIVQYMSSQVCIYTVYPENLSFFSKLYTVTEEEQYITTIQYISFRKLLLDHIQFLFFSEEHLEEIIIKIFTRLGIKDIEKDKVYRLKIKEDIKYDLIINCRDKTIHTIMNEILHNGLI
jgi:broad-specificity NMP kinase